MHVILQYFAEEVEDATLPEHLRGPQGVQQAEHISTTSTIDDGTQAPRGSPTEMNQMKVDAIRR